MSQEEKFILRLKVGSIRLLLGATMLIIGCAPMSEPKAIPSTELQEKSNPQPLTLDQLRNASYYGIYDASVKLTDGKYEGSPFQPGAASRPQVILVDKLIAWGDLDGDGSDEAVVLLAENSGASGTRNYLAVVAVRGGKPVNVATHLLGDRVQLRAIRIESGRLVVDTASDDVWVKTGGDWKKKKTRTLSTKQDFKPAKKESGS